MAASAKADGGVPVQYSGGWRSSLLQAHKPHRRRYRNHLYPRHAGCHNAKGERSVYVFGREYGMSEIVLSIFLKVLKKSNVNVMVSGNANSRNHYIFQPRVEFSAFAHQFSYCILFLVC